MYSRDVLTVVGEEQCAFSFPLGFGFPCAKKQNRKRSQIPLCGMKGGQGRKVCGPVPSPSTHLLLSVSLEVCKNRFFLCQLVSPSNVKVKLYLHLLVNNFYV